MERAFDFRDTVKDEARLRQDSRCAHCGDDLNDVWEHAHHVVPNQSGRPGDVGHAWLASADNCVILCDDCHGRVHENGRTRLGAIAPPESFPHSHGSDVPGHQQWVLTLNRLTRSVWPGRP